MLWPTHPLPESRQCSPCYRTLLPAYKVPLARASPLQSRRGGQGRGGSMSSRHARLAVRAFIFVPLPPRLLRAP